MEQSIDLELLGFSAFVFCSMCLVFIAGIFIGKVIERNKPAKDYRDANYWRQLTDNFKNSK